jgi:hypothetical protein
MRAKQVNARSSKFLVNFDGQEEHERFLGVFGWLKLFGEHWPAQASLKKF